MRATLPETSETTRTELQALAVPTASTLSRTKPRRGVTTLTAVAARARCSPMVKAASLFMTNQAAAEQDRINKATIIWLERRIRSPVGKNRLREHKWLTGEYQGWK